MKRASRPLRTVRDVRNFQDYLKAHKTVRDYTLFVLGVTTGYRAGDLVLLQVRDVKEALRRGEFTIKEGKKYNHKNIRKSNRRPRIVEIPSRLEKVLRDYIKGMKDYEYLFKSRKGINKPIGVPQVSNILKEVADYFGLYDITAHSMRKTYAFKIYIESKKDALVVKELLGHSSLEETKKYLGIEKDTISRYNRTLNDFIG